MLPVNLAGAPVQRCPGHLTTGALVCAGRGLVCVKAVWEVLDKVASQAHPGEGTRAPDLVSEQLCCWRYPGSKEPA